MSAVVVDTHAIIWYLAGDRRLSQNATDILDEATANGEPIHVPSICLIELTYVVEKGRIPMVARDRLVAAIDDPGTPCMPAPLDRRVVDAVGQVHRSEVPDLPDRVIAGTALALRLPLISRDGRIRTSQIKTIW
jgi:PIN domain nuclease of toxin-antitoxin system